MLYILFELLPANMGSRVIISYKIAPKDHKSVLKSYFPLIRSGDE